MLIDGVEYRKVVGPDDERWRIVVCDRGFVLVGMVHIEDGYVILRKCHCVRRWGTTRGLGQIAMEGPTSNTILDPQPTTRVHELQVIQQIDCEESKWKL